MSKQKIFVVTRNLLNRIIMEAYSNGRSFAQGFWYEDKLPVEFMKDAEKRIMIAMRKRKKSK